MHVSFNSPNGVAPGNVEIIAFLSGDNKPYWTEDVNDEHKSFVLNEAKKCYGCAFQIISYREDTFDGVIFYLSGEYVKEADPCVR